MTMPIFGKKQRWQDFDPEPSMHGSPQGSEPGAGFQHAAATSSQTRPAKKKSGCFQQCFGMGGGGGDSRQMVEEQIRRAEQAAALGEDAKPLQIHTDGSIRGRGKKNVVELEIIVEEDINATNSFRSKATPPEGIRRLSAPPAPEDAAADAQHRAARAVPYKITQPVDEISAEVVFNENSNTMTSPYTVAMDRSSATIANHVAAVRWGLGPSS